MLIRYLGHAFPQLHGSLWGVKPHQREQQDSEAVHRPLGRGGEERELGPPSPREWGWGSPTEYSSGCSPARFGTALCWSRTTRWTGPIASRPRTRRSASFPSAWWGGAAPEECGSFVFADMADVCSCLPCECGCYSSPDVTCMQGGTVVAVFLCRGHRGDLYRTGSTECDRPREQPCGGCGDLRSHRPGHLQHAAQGRDRALDPRSGRDPVLQHQLPLPQQAGRHGVSKPRPHHPCRIHGCCCLLFVAVVCFYAMKYLSSTRWGWWAGAVLRPGSRENRARRSGP